MTMAKGGCKGPLHAVLGYENVCYLRLELISRAPMQQQ